LAFVVSGEGSGEPSRSFHLTMKKQQRYVYVVSPGGLGCTAFFGSYEIDHLKDVPEAVDAPVPALAGQRESTKRNWIASTLRLPVAMGRAVRQRLQRRLSGAAA
jgi:hypothetical protein